MNGENLKAKLKEIASLDLNKVIKQDSHGKKEANVRSIIVEELLKCLGWSKKIGDLDFEHNINNKFADIALMVETPTKERKPKVIIECKDVDEDLDRHIEQAFKYAESIQVRWVILTNGREFRLYTTFIENVPDRRDHLLISPPIQLAELDQRFGELNSWIS